jgi:DME family drug/metabolite transporter
MRALFMALGAAILWGTTGTARALGPASAPPLAVGAARIAVGGAALVALALVRGTLIRAWPPLPALASALAVAAYQLSFFEGVARAGVAVGTILAIGSAPAFAGLLAWLALGERPGARWAVATAVAVAGIALLALPDAAVPRETLALLLPLAAGASYAVYATATKRLLASADNVAVAAVAFGGGAVLLIPVFVFADMSWLADPRGLGVVLWLGLGATALAYILFTRALARLPVSHGATLSLAEPLTASLLGVLVLGERLGPPQLAGAALVAAGLAILATASRAGAPPQSSGGS